MCRGEGRKAGERRRRFYPLTSEGRRVLARQRATGELVHAMDLITGGDHGVTCRTTARGPSMWGPPRSAATRPDTRGEIIEELSQHLEERYEELRAGGAAMPRLVTSQSRSCSTPHACDVYGERSVRQRRADGRARGASKVPVERRLAGRPLCGCERCASSRRYPSQPVDVALGSAPTARCSRSSMRRC